MNPEYARKVRRAELQRARYARRKAGALAPLPGARAVPVRCPSDGQWLMPGQPCGTCAALEMYRDGAA